MNTGRVKENFLVYSKLYQQFNMVFCINMVEILKLFHFLMQWHNKCTFEKDGWPP